MSDKDRFKTEQELFWSEEFGNSYIERTRPTQKDIASVLHFFGKVLARTHGVSSVMELGANTGINLAAIHQLIPDAELAAVEINTNAFEELNQVEYIKEVYLASILEFEPSRKYDLCFSKGVLIHICPDKLQRVYELMHRTSSRYILVAEYYNPSPVEVVYRGHRDKLFKRDFAGEMLEMFPDLDLLDYGFCYRRDPIFPQDDLTWFLLRKTS